MTQVGTLAKTLRDTCRVLVFVCPILLVKCGAAVGGGIVDNGQHPSDDGRGQTDGKNPTGNAGSTAPGDTAPSGTVSGSNTVNLDGIYFSLPAKFAAAESDQYHGFYKRGDDWIRMTIVTQACDGASVKTNTQGTKLITCGDDWIDFETAGHKYLRMNYKLSNSDRDFIADSVKD